MIRQPGFFGTDARLQALSAAGGPLERLARVVDFELFRPGLEQALARAGHSRSGRPPYDAVMMFRVLILQTLYTLLDDQTEYQLRDRLPFMRFVGLALHNPVPDAKTIWLYRERLTRAGALACAFSRFDAMLRERGYLAMGRQIIGATAVEARRPRLNREEKQTPARRRHPRRLDARPAASDRPRRTLDPQARAESAASGGSKAPGGAGDPDADVWLQEPYQY